MTNLPRLDSFDLKNKKVIVRLDLDISGNDYSRLEAAKPTIDFLKEQAERILVIGHKGRPEGKSEQNLTLSGLEGICSKIFGLPISGFVAKYNGLEEFYKTSSFSNGLTCRFIILENLRFDPGEETNDDEFTKRLASIGDFYVNEAFATSHRESASIVGLPKLLPHAAGFRFAEEVQNLSQVLENPSRPLVI